MGFSRRQAPPALTRRRMRPALAALCVAALSSGALAPAASANESSRVIERCAKGQSLAGFSEPALARALRELSTVLQEYSNCEELIRRAELAAASNASPAARAAALAGAPAGASFGGEAPLAPTPSEQPALAAARRSGGSRQEVGGRAITPGVVHVDLGSAVSSLPDSLLAALAALAALALTAGGRLILAGATGSEGGRRPFGRAGRRSPGAESAANGSPAPGSKPGEEEQTR